MRVKIIRKNFGGVEFGPEMRVLHLGGQSSANVERLKFELPQGLAVNSLPTAALYSSSSRIGVGSVPSCRWMRSTAQRWAKNLPPAPAAAGCCWLWVRTDTGR